MVNALFDDVVRAIQKWVPEKHYRSEKGYQNDLSQYLRNAMKQPQGLLSQSADVTVHKESGREVCDVVVNRTVGIELKYNLKRKSDVDRLVGQVTGYKKEYDGVIIALVGNVYPDVVDQLKSKLQSESGTGVGLGAPAEAPVRIIEIGKDGAAQDKGGSTDPFGSDGLFGI